MVTLTSQVQQTPPAPTDYTMFYAGIAVAAVAVVAGVFIVLRRRRGPVQVAS